MLGIIGGILFVLWALIEIWFFWCHFSLWKILAKNYSFSEDLPDLRRTKESITLYYYAISPTVYVKTVNLAIDNDALYLWLSKPLFPFKKKLRIPFSELKKVGRSKIFLWGSNKNVIFTTAADRQLKICLSESAVQWVETEWRG